MKVEVSDDEWVTGATGASSEWRYRALHLLVGVAVMFAGAIEGRYGRLELSGDDISYLDVANMIRVGDWRAALNPLWSIGYPLLLSVVRRLFPSTLSGEMASVFWLNLTIYFVAWIGFLWLLGLMSRAVRADLSSDEDARMSPFLLIGAACLFVTVQTGVGRVSTVGPDLLVACLFFFASGLAWKVYSCPTAGNTALWGVVLGLGFLSKAIFLTLSGIFFLVVMGFMVWRRRVAPLLRTAGVFLLFVVPYGAGLSWALGRPTLGEAGTLNYAFHVNHLKHWMGWQGGPKEFGLPIHPVEMLSVHPPVFAFGDPFHVTYPPQFNIVYWYEGYRQFFDFKNSARALVENTRTLQYAFQEIIPVALVVALCFCAAFWPRAGERVGARRSLNPWLLYLPSLLGIFAFLLVHIEGRYVAGFLCVLAMAPFLRLDSWRGGLRSVVRATALLLLLVATIFNSTERLRGPVRLAAAGTDMQSGGQWAVAEYLLGLSLKAGDRVASVSPGNNIRCTWAYAARLHIVAAIGNDAYDPKNQVQDLHLFFDNPTTQANVLELFRQQGAVAVVATEIPFDVSSPGWERVPGSRAWVFLLRPRVSDDR